MDYILPSSHNFWLPLRIKALWKSRQNNTHDLPSAQRISPPMAGSSEGENFAYVELNGEVYILTWSGSVHCPDLENFPQSFNTRKIDLSEEAARTWAQSRLLNHGADSCIRQDSGSLPILKLAHPNLVARARLKHEFEMLQTMNECASLPIPRFHQQPLVDSDGIYGYRMERLDPIDFGNLPQYHQAVKDALHQVHDAGFALGDLHPGNMMLNERDELIFIDLAYAGKLGTTIPSCIPRTSYSSDVFHVKPDTDRLAYFFFGDEHGWQAVE